MTANSECPSSKWQHQRLYIPANKSKLCKGNPPPQDQKPSHHTKDSSRGWGQRAAGESIGVRDIEVKEKSKDSDSSQLLSFCCSTQYLLLPHIEIWVFKF